MAEWKITEDLPEEEVAVRALYDRYETDYPGLSNRAVNILVNEGLTPEQVTDMTDNELLRRPGVGKVVLKELRDELGRHQTLIEKLAEFTTLELMGELTRRIELMLHEESR